MNKQLQIIENVKKNYETERMVNNKSSVKSH